MSALWCGQGRWAGSRKLVLHQSLSTKNFKLPHIKPQNEDLVIWKSSTSP